jgi:hypothetical protein
LGYLHISNLYSVPEILECYALEKVHGTSAHIRFAGGIVHYFSGGSSHTHFIGLFDQVAIETKFKEKFLPVDDITLYGEAFGGSLLGMSDTYGKQLRFIVFDVNINDTCLNVPSAEGLAGEFGLAFVPYERGPLTLEWLNEQRDRPSRVAVVPDKPSEGIVIRPIREDASRFIYKHKTAKFRETKTQREVDPNRAIILTEAITVADEWVTRMRLQHVLDKTPLAGTKDMGNVIRAMQEDVRRESDGEVKWSKEVASAIAKATAKLIQTMPVTA